MDNQSLLAKFPATISLLGGLKGELAWSEESTFIIPNSHLRTITHSFKQLFHQSIHFFFCKKAKLYVVGTVPFCNKGEFQEDNGRCFQQGIASVQ